MGGEAASRKQFNFESLVMLPPPYTDQDPAAVVRFEGGKFVPCDAAGETFLPAAPVAGGRLNNRTVVYELPTSRSKINVSGDPQIGVGTFRDVLALVDAGAAVANFPGTPALRPGRSHLLEFGVNALELLPVADSFVEREWGTRRATIWPRTTTWGCRTGTPRPPRMPTSSPW